MEQQPIDMGESRGKILIIDDDPFFLKVLTDNFSENGFTVFNANDGVEGVKAYLENAPDAVISDLVMPRMGGVIPVSNRRCHQGGKD